MIFEISSNQVIQMRATPAFIAGGKRDINKVFDNIKA
ncbi:alkaline amylopullulanase [Streptococcus thermophilus]|nr:alkaline amylopullulanase [Streptococcus thermophilus]ELW74727.1 alkaline amylopullulanase [Streptococcus thermophilus MTCC 5461]ELW74773.1 alkaline amylopullulanase [Streptococcus thermophilus MTCC 5460]MBN6048364.1 alkaline amylopullulanase [Streptococcus thermophilus]MCT2895259.1 alkaline amylopullulanase [Streptococcus thermophilus]